MLVEHPPRTVFYTQDSQELALAEAPASFSGFRSFRILLPRAPSTITRYEYYSPLSPGSVQESLLGCPAPPCVLFFYARDVGELGFRLALFLNAALAEALASFSGFRESCSRCSAGLISALPLDPNRAPAAALASFPVPCHGMQCNAMLCSAARCHAFSCNAMICSA